MAKKTHNELFLAAIDQANDAEALRLLDAGADPLYVGTVGRRRESAFECAVGNRRDNVVSAILDRLTDSEKDQLLVEQARKKNWGCVLPLLEAGADGTQLVDGRTLLQLASNGSEAVRRILRSQESCALLDAAMGGGEPTPAPPANHRSTSPIL